MANRFSDTVSVLLGNGDGTFGKPEHLVTGAGPYEVVIGDLDNDSVNDLAASAWSQDLPALGTLLGENRFALGAEDVTPVPFNQPPYPPSGDKWGDSCTVTGLAP